MRDNRCYNTITKSQWGVNLVVAFVIVTLIMEETVVETTVLGRCNWITYYQGQMVNVMVFVADRYHKRTYLNTIDKVYQQQRLRLSIMV